MMLEKIVFKRNKGTRNIVFCSTSFFPSVQENEEITRENEYNALVLPLSRGLPHPKNLVDDEIFLKQINIEGLKTNI